MGGSYPQPIRYSEISQYARDHGFVEDFDEFAGLVVAQDTVFLIHHADERKKEADKAKRKAKK